MMLQVEAEIDALGALFYDEGVRSFLEIGSKFGGSLTRLAGALPATTRVVSVDLPKGTKAWRESEIALKTAIIGLQQQGYDAHLVWGDSTAPDVIAQVRALGPFDACFFDGNHTRSYVERDFASYGPMSRILAFHDIAWRRASEWEGVRIDVPQFWDEVKKRYRHKEFRMCPTGKNNGIGVLWTH